MQTVNNIIKFLQYSSVGLCTLIVVISFIKMMIAEEPFEQQKQKKHIRYASIFLVLVISIIPFKNMVINYFGKDIGIGTIEQKNITFDNIYDYDKDGRNTYLIDGKLYVAYKTLSKDGLTVEGLKEFYDCQGITKGLLAKFHYIRYIESGGAFPLGTIILYDEDPPTTIIKPNEYKVISNNQKWSNGNGEGRWIFRQQKR